MEAALITQSVTTPAQSDEVIVKAGLLLREAFSYGEDCYERPEYAEANALLMESAKFEAGYNGRTIATEYHIAYGLAFDVAYSDKT